MKTRKVFFARLISLIAVLLLIFVCQTILQRFATFDHIVHAQAKTGQYVLDTAYTVLTGESASGLTDGTYEGTAKGYGGPVTVSVTVTGGRIASIDVTSHAKEDAAYYNMAVATVDDILSAQTPDVDTVSGATFTSNAIKNAVILALEQAIA